VGSPDDQAGDMDARLLVGGLGSGVLVGSGESESEWVSTEELSVVKRRRGGERGSSCGCAMAGIRETALSALLTFDRFLVFTR
jgi:hypothetical protein